MDGKSQSKMEELNTIKFGSMFDLLSCQFIELKVNHLGIYISLLGKYIHNILETHLDSTTWSYNLSTDPLPGLLSSFIPSFYKDPSSLDGRCSGESSGGKNFLDINIIIRLV